MSIEQALLEQIRFLTPPRAATGSFGLCSLPPAAIAWRLEKETYTRIA